MSTSGSCRGLRSGGSFLSALRGACSSGGPRKALKGTWEEATQLGAASSSRERGACGHSRSSRDAVCSWEGTSGALANLPNSGAGAGGREARQLGRPTPPGRRAREKHSQHRRPPQALAPAPSPRAVPFPSGEGARGGRGPQPRACGAAGACPPPPPGGAPACNSARGPLSSAPARRTPSAAAGPFWDFSTESLGSQPPGSRTVSRRTPSTLPTPGGGSGSSRKRSGRHCPSTCPLLTRGPRAVAPGPGRVHRVLCDSGGGLRAPDATCSALPRARRPTRGSPHGRWSPFSWLVVISNGLYPSSIS